MKNLGKTLCSIAGKGIASVAILMGLFGASVLAAPGDSCNGTLPGECGAGEYCELLAQSPNTGECTVVPSGMACDVTTLGGQCSTDADCSTNTQCLGGTCFMEASYSNSLTEAEFLVECNLPNAVWFSEGKCKLPCALCTAGNDAGLCSLTEVCNADADCASGFCDAGVCAEPASCDLTDAAADCDMDGNPNGTDPNPEVPTAVDDGVFPMSAGTAGTEDILGNDDFLPGADTSITDTGNGTAAGVVSFDPITGTITYTPTAAEEGTTVTVEYEVCNEAVDPAVCDIAVVTIEVTPSCDLTDATLDCDMDGNPNGTDPNPEVPTATDDGVFPMSAGTAGTEDILGNDDFLPGADTSITDTGNGTATGTVSFDPIAGTITYTPTAGEVGTTVTVEYEVCNEAVDPAVCDIAVVTIEVAATCDSTDASLDTAMCPIGDSCPNGAADCASGYCDMAASPAVCACNLMDPDQDCDMDGNPNGTDPNPEVPTATDDGLYTAPVGSPIVEDNLGNDDFLPGADTSITDTGAGTAVGTVTFDPMTGEVTYTADPSEVGTVVTVVYEVCNEAVDPAVCDTAEITFDVICDLMDPDQDCDNDGTPNGIDPNTEMPTAVDDGIFPGVVGSDIVEDILGNDDFLPGTDVSIADTGAGTAVGTVTFDPVTGEVTYTPDPSEEDSIVTVVYEVCYDETGECDIAEITFEILLDSDNDGIPDIDDIDDDNDGIPDVVEQNGDPLRDTDGDGIIDSLDLDADNDGILDVTEAGGEDLDNDGVVDDLTDTDGDGLMDIVDANPAVIDDPQTPEEGIDTTTQPVRDTDGDGIRDFQDLDSDNDGINDVIEAGHIDPDGDGMVDVTTIDENGIPVDEDGVLISNSEPQDHDGDGIPDWHDLDSDNDGINDVIEGGNADPDGDGIVGAGDPAINVDGQVVDPSTGDPISTSDIPDTDEDGIPDWHDLDSDNDGINDVIEGGNADPDDDGIVGVGDPVVNDDGQAQGATSAPTDWDEDGIPDYLDLDSDNDGINDVIEGGNSDPDGDGIVGTGDPVVDEDGLTEESNSMPVDSDEDGIPDYHDLDSDNDGINDVTEGGNDDPDGDGIVGTGDPEVNEDGQVVEPGAEDVLSTSAPTDWDEDGIPDYLDLDSDNDGINDVIEGGNDDPDGNGTIDTPVNENGQTEGATSDPLDTDGDDVPDYHDLDSDNDGINDVEEGGNSDPDGDGIVGTGDPVVDEDGLTDESNSTPTDTDEDGTPDFRELDSDDDGILDVIEAGLGDPDGDGLIGTGTPVVNTDGQAPGATSAPVDTDADGMPDYQDLDSDNGGLPDRLEGPAGTDVLDPSDDKLSQAGGGSSRPVAPVARPEPVEPTPTPAPVVEPEVIVPAPVVAEVVDVMPELTIVEVELIEQIEEMKEEIALSQDPSFVQHNSAGIQSSNLPEYLPQTGAEVK